MRCIIILDTMIQFFHGDDEYLDSVSKQIASRLRSDESDRVASSEFLFSKLDTLWGFFAPLATSYYLMARSGKPYSSIKTDAGFTLVFQKFGDMLCIAVNGDGKETELELLRKTFVLHELTRTFVGPLEEQLYPGDVHARTQLWNKIGQCLDSWSLLYNTRPAILVEGVERIQVKDEIIVRCREEVKRCFSSLKVAEIHPILHSMVFVDSKLFLHIFHSDPQLHSQAYLLLSTYVHANFQSPPPDRIDPDHPRYHKERLFLPTSACAVTPFTVYSLEFYVGMVLVLLIRCNDPHLANHLHRSISHLQSIITLAGLNKRPENTRDVVLVIDVHIKKAGDTWERINFAAGADQFRSLCEAVVTNWERCKAEGLTEAIEGKKLTPSHENRLNKVLRDLQRIFSILYYVRVSDGQKDSDAMMVCCKILNMKFAYDYGEFLQVKAERNAHANINVSEYPQLAYYLFLNRKNDAYSALNFCERDYSVGVSCMDEMCASRGEKSGQVLKKQIWEFVDRVHRFSQHACTMQVWEDKYFVSSYHVWLCNQRSGVRVACQERLFPEGVPPGIMTDSSCYRKYGKDGVVLELYLIHMGGTKINKVVSHAELISEKLWQLSRESPPRFASIL